MWGNLLVIPPLVLGALLCQGFATKATRLEPKTTKNEHDLDVLVESNEGDQGINIVLNPDQSSSIWTTLEHLQNENLQLRQDLQKDKHQLVSLVRGLQEDASVLKKRQNDAADLMVAMMEDLAQKMGGRLRQSVQEVTRQVERVKGELGEVKKNGQEVMGESVEVVRVVMETVAKFEDLVQNVSARLGHLQDRTASLENHVSRIQAGEEECTQQLTDVQLRMDILEFWLQSGYSTDTPRTTTTTTTTSTTTPIPTTTTTSTPHIETTTPIYPPTSTVQPATFTIPPVVNNNDNLVTSLLVTKAGQLLIGDQFGHRLTLSMMDSPNDVLDVLEIHRPCAMLELQDGTIAVTMHQELSIAVIKITSDGLSRLEDIPVGKRYNAITDGPGNTLIVSGKREFSSNSIDVINMDGQLERTILHGVDSLINPFCLKRFGDDVYVSDWSSSRVFRVNIYNGEVKFTMGDLDLRSLGFYQPRKMDLDDYGNLYVATGGNVCHTGSFCIVRVTQSGDWQVMEQYTSPNGGSYPYGLEVTSSQIIVSWCTWVHYWYSEVASFPLPQLPEGSDKVEPALTNVALHKPALQSTYHPLYGHPERAVDGSTANAIRQCTHTADIDRNPIRWWRVDLMGMFQVEGVRITNRGDCCGYRLAGFSIYVVKALADPSEIRHTSSDLCLRHDQSVAEGATVRLECHRPIVGQYVSLVLPSVSWPLHFCEFEVLGRPAAARTTPAPPPRQTSPIIDEEDLDGSGSSGSGDVDSVQYSGSDWFEI